MATPRLADPTAVTSTPSMKIRPSVTSSIPQMRRSNVDFPQPEGPTKTTRSRSFTFNSMERRASKVAKRLPTDLSSMLPTAVSENKLAFGGGCGNAFDKVPLKREENDKHGKRRKGGRGHRCTPHGLPLIRLGIVGNPDRQDSQLFVTHRDKRPKKIAPAPDENDDGQAG